MKAIDKLSFDILLEIFSFLDVESLRNATLASKKWSDLIGSKVVTMKQFILKLDPQKIKKPGNHRIFSTEMCLIKW